jgi:hypothetical protein
MNLLNVLFQPTTTFERLKGKGGWVLSLILLCVIPLGSVLLQWPLMEATFAKGMQSAGGEVPEEQLAMIMNISKYSAIGGAFNTLLDVTLTAGIVLAVGGLGVVNVMMVGKKAEVTSAPAATGVLSESVFANGRVFPASERSLFTHVGGKVAAVLVKEGDAVKKGDVVLRFDTEGVAAPAGGGTEPTSDRKAAAGDGAQAEFRDGARANRRGRDREGKGSRTERPGALRAA